MRLSLFFLLLSGIFLLSGQITKAQPETIDKPANDSLSSQIQIDTVDKSTEAFLLIKRADSARISDSIQKEVLKAQIEELKTYETKKRQELEDKLNELSQADSIKKVKAKIEIDSLKKSATGIPIIPYKDTLFLVYTRIGRLTPAERAKVIHERIADLYEEYILRTDTLIVADYGATVDITFQEKTIVSISDLDAMWFEKNKMDIAHEIQKKLLSDIVVYKEEKSFLKKVKEIGLTILIIVVQVFLIWLVTIFFKRKINPYLESKKGIWFKSLSIKSYKLLDDSKLTQVVLFLVKLFRYFINLIQLYITFPLIFSIFPPTRRLAENLLGYVLTPIKSSFWSLVNYIPDLITVIVIVVITRYIIKLLRYIASEVEAGALSLPGFYPDWARPTFNIIRVLVLAFMFVVIFPYLPGSDSPVFQGVSVFLGIVFSLGSSSTIGNMIAGLVITYMRPFKLGDRIKIGDLVGDVIEKTPFVTRLRTTKHEYITVPNSNVLSSSVINYSTSKEKEGIILYSTITIGYDVPWRQVHELLIGSALKTKNVLSSPAPFVLQTSLDDFYVSYQINVYSDRPNLQAGIYSELHQNIQDAFNEAGVEILSPHYRAARDGNTIAIPEEYRPADYTPPSFNLKNK